MVAKPIEKYLILSLFISAAVLLVIWIGPTASHSQGGGSNLPAPCCDCTTGGKNPQPIGCLNKVCPSGPAIWDFQTKICGCSGGGGGAAAAAPSSIASLGLDKSLGGLLNNFTDGLGPTAMNSISDQIGKMIGSQLGNLVANQLGKILPGGIGSQIGNFLGGQLGNQLSGGLSNIFSSASFGQDLSSPINSLFSNTISSVDPQVESQLVADLGPIEGQNAANQLDTSFTNSFDSTAQSEFIDSTDQTLTDLVDNSDWFEAGLTPVACTGAECALTNISPEEKLLRNNIDNLVKDNFGGDYKASFDNYAKNGSLGMDELKNVLKDADVGNFATRGAWADAIIKKFDTNGDGRISLTEFCTGIGKCVGI